MSAHCGACATHLATAYAELQAARATGDLAKVEDEYRNFDNLLDEINGAKRYQAKMLGRVSA